MECGESKLWNYLDECGVEFRRSRAELVKLYNSYNCGWTDDLNYCEPGCRQPFIEGLAHPVVFQFTDVDDLSQPPTYLEAFVRQSKSPQENLNFAVAQIEALFGPGQDASVSNTESKVWNFGLARVRATIWPKDLNTEFGRNNRHESIPGSETECKIEIETAYCPGVSDAEATALSRYVTISETQLPSHWKRHFSSLSRRVDHQITRGFGIDQDAKFLIRIDDERIVHFLPVEWIRSVSYHQLLPAKGGGSISINVDYRPNATGRSTSLPLLNVKYKKGAFRSHATDLSQKLLVPLVETKEYDC